MLNEAIEAARSGQRSRARDLLTRLLRTDKSNIDYWLWMSSVVDSPKEQIFCLKSALRLDPLNRIARVGLITLGAVSPEEAVQPVPPARRDRWQVEEIEGGRPTGLAGLLANPLVRVILVVGAAVLVISLILAGFFEARNRRQANELQALIRLTLTAQPSPTLTVEPTLTRTPVFRTPTPTFARPTPLWMLLEATYTPTPLYVNTPHPSAEAYRAAIRAYERQQWNRVLEFMDQVVDIEPDAADAYYYIGEAHRFLGEWFPAQQAYNQALEVNRNFAPAYLGRARARQASDPEADIRDDLDQAIVLDPNLAEAFLERAAILTSSGDPQAALEDLEVVEIISPDSPLLYLHRAQAYLELQDFPQALTAAQQANALDITLLPAYLFIGQAHQGNGQARLAIESLRTYLLYDEASATAWALLGLAYQDLNQSEAALEAFERALSLDPSQLDLYLLRGKLYVELGQQELAIDDLSRVVRFRPGSFEANLELGLGYLAFEEFGNAYIQFNETLSLAETDRELAILYYWRAQSLELLNEPAAATRDWEAMLALPPEAMPEAWITQAEEHILLLNPPTPTTSPTPTITLTPSVTPTITPTPTRTPSPTPRDR